MCNACGHPARPGHWMDAGLDGAPDRRRAALARAALLTRALKPYGLTARASASGLILSTLTGTSTIVADRAQIWPTVERLAGRPYDPLSF